MRNNLHLLVGILTSTIIISCGVSKNFTATGTNEEIVFNASQVLKKHPSNKPAKDQLVINYNRAREEHGRLIEQLKNGSEPDRSEKVLEELNILQELYTVVNKLSPAITGSMELKNYAVEIKATKDNAAEENYQAALRFLEMGGWLNARSAYNSFKKADQFIANYKESAKKMKELFSLNTVNIVINPLKIDSPYSKAKIIFNDNREKIQKRLVKELEGGLHEPGAGIPARFYTDEEAKKKNIRVDWVIDLNMKDILYKYHDYSFTDEGIKPIENKTVYSTLKTTNREFTVSANMEYTFTEMKSNTILEKDQLPVSYNWEDKLGSYTGDTQALGSYDWDLINNDGTKSFIEGNRMISELYGRAYPNIKDQILYAVTW